MALSSLITVSKRRSRIHRLMQELVDALNTDAAIGHDHDGTDSALLSPSGNTLDQSYDQGGAGAGRAITVDSGAVALTNNAVNNNGVFTVTKNPVGAQSGDGVVVTMGAQATGAALNIANTGSGNDITGTNWSVSQVGSLTAVSVILGTNPASAGTVRIPNAAWIAGRNAANSADINIVRVDGSNRSQFAAAAVFDATIAVTGTATFSAAVTFDGGVTFNAAVTLTSTGAIDINGNEFILDADGNTSITADTDNQIDIRINGADDFQFTANAFTALGGSNVAVADDGLLMFGTVARLSWDTTDANANALLLQLPAGGGTDVPVLAIGQSIESVDLGLFNGVVDPNIAVFGVGAVTTGSRLRVYKARGTVASPTVVTSGDDLFSIDAYGAVAAGEYVQAARILFEMTGTIATTRGPGVMTFQTATDAAPSVLTTALVIGADQSITLGSAADATGVLRVANNVWVSAENAAGNGNVNMISVNGSNLVAFGANVAAFTAAGAITMSSANVVVGANAVTLTTGNVTFSGAGYIAMGVNPASAGYIRLANAVNIAFRNAANGADVNALTVNAADDVAVGADLQLNGNTLFGGTADNADLTLAATTSATVTTSYIVANQMVDVTTNSIAIRVKAGAIGDGETAQTDLNGELGIDSTNGRFYFRYGAAWHYTAITAGFQVPVSEVSCPQCGKAMKVNERIVGRIESVMADKALHGLYEHERCPV